MPRTTLSASAVSFQVLFEIPRPFAGRLERFFLFWKSLSRNVGVCLLRMYLILNYNARGSFSLV